MPSFYASISSFTDEMDIKSVFTKMIKHYSNIKDTGWTPSQKVHKRAISLAVVSCTENNVIKRTLQSSHSQSKCQTANKQDSQKCCLNGPDLHADCKLQAGQNPLDSQPKEKQNNPGQTSEPHAPHLSTNMDECHPKGLEFLIERGQRANSHESLHSGTGNSHRTLKEHSTDGDSCFSDFYHPCLSPSLSWGDVDPPSFHTRLMCNIKSQADPGPTSENNQVKNTVVWQMGGANVDDTSSDQDQQRWCDPDDPSLSLTKSYDMDPTGMSGLDLSFIWNEESDGERNSNSRLDLDFRGASEEDRHFVCPITLKKVMSGPAHSLIDVEEERLKIPQLLCRQSLSLVYSTIDENYAEGTLQLLSDLLQPGFYPPKDITAHLLHGILLNLQCPYHLCVHAFDLLMRTQRHHRVDTNTVPWSWELLTSVMAKEEQTYRCEVVRMLLEYIVQTLEDDFQYKRSISALHHSIAKAMLSCEQQFPHVRDIIQWLISTIKTSVGYGEAGEVARNRDEQIRIVSVFQRMLALSLEVDGSPALNSAKLSQELFIKLLSIPSRAHRMLLLESLQSKLLRCKLLEHLLDFACPLKIPVPMSLSLLLHYFKNCTLTPDLMDGTERWRKWEELIHLLWMLLLSYNKAHTSYLCRSGHEPKGNNGSVVYRLDIITKSAVCEAVEAFQARSQADLGEALPLHVEESLTYLQDYLLDVCQC